MSGAQTLQLGELVDGAGAGVMLQLDSSGAVTEAWFSLNGLPRVEGLLRGRPIDSVPTLIEHLCGICPVAHHLAGVQALEKLSGYGPIPPSAQAIRRLVHFGEVLHSHARQLAHVDTERARDLRYFARQVLTAAAGPGHFPRCAVPGGVLSAVPAGQREALRVALDNALERATALLAQLERQPPAVNVPGSTVCDVALVAADGTLDLCGDQLRAVSATGFTVVGAAGPEEWLDTVAEARPGVSASRPYLRVLGPERGRYRVGPVAQLRASTHLSTPAAEQARERWAAAGGGAAWARAVVALHAVEAIGMLADLPDIVAGPLLAHPAVPGGTSTSDTGTGWVDGARGLLVHTYQIGEQRELIEARITTPTAQNEGWLAVLLTPLLQRHDPVSSYEDMPLPEQLVASMEAAVREADPCLPCTSFPVNAMELAVTALDPTGHIVTRWEPQRRGLLTVETAG